ncbi:MAG: hypothetical protein ACRECH_09945 [Nitrososphaerales archaeon]
MKDRKNLMPSVARYPIFFLGLLIMIVGGLVAMQVGAPLSIEVVLASVGFVLVAISVAIR